MNREKLNLKGITAALAAPTFLGMAPIFGKLAITAGADSFTVAALRTLVAVALLWGVYILFFRRFIYIYPAGLMGCAVIGIINGIGSLFYYGGLGLLDASLVQLINGMYLAFAVILSHLAGQKPDMRTLIRVGMAIAALILLTGFGNSAINWVGVGFMLASALMFAGTVMLSQYVLYEMPSRTATLYILTTMGVVVTMVWLAVGDMPSLEVLQLATGPIILLGITTAFSRLAMFAGVKFLGGMQTAIMAILEIGVALSLAALFLGERLTSTQWIGVIVLGATLLLIRERDLLPRGINPTALIAANLPSVQFQRIAFHRAFGTAEMDNELGTMAQITTQEMVAIQQMMGAKTGGIDPYPINASVELLASLPDDPLATQEFDTTQDDDD
ncbi:MAG: DMT family transporter [Chloroflexi bacterium]|nr:MAG: DMT family transporter [Chloroflexota bacterium]